MNDFRILIVDDNRDLADRMAVMLQQEGYSTTAVYTGEDAVAYVLAESYDLAVIDAKLPAIDGVEVFLAIRKLRPDIAGIMINAQGVNNVFKKLAGQGELVVLQKPFQMEAASDIISAIRQEESGALPA